MKAVTFDFYNTLVHHRGMGRGKEYQLYLDASDLTSGPWEHQVLYDVFEYYGSDYRPDLSAEDKLSFWTEFTRRLFERTRVRGRGSTDFRRHAPAIRDIMGPESFVLFDDVLDTLRALRRAAVRVGVVSDWQKGLLHFCAELGIADLFDAVVASSEVGFQKPDPRLFAVAQRKLGVSPDEILHVGDTAADIEGAGAAGFSALLIDRSGASAPEQGRIASLREVLQLV